MKKLILASLIALSATVFAAPQDPASGSPLPLPMDANGNLVCPQKIEDIVTLIQSRNSCFEVVDVATKCAWGSSADLQIAGAAREVCLKEAGAISKADQALLARMDKRCAASVKGQQGTMYMSIAAFCRLKAADFINGVQSSGM